MSRKGYQAEYHCKKENESKYGVGNCIKVAIGGSSDYIILDKGELIKFIEVKQTVKKGYYPNKREKNQISRIIDLGKQHNADVELWVYFIKKHRRKLSIIHKRILFSRSVEDIK